MSPTAYWVGLALWAVEVGWQPLPDGRLEVIVQLTPQMVPQARPGENLGTFELPLRSRPVRRLRVTVGTEALPRLGERWLAPAPAHLATTLADTLVIPPFDPLPWHEDYPSDRITPSIGQPPRLDRTAAWVATPTAVPGLRPGPEDAPHPHTPSTASQPAAESAPSPSESPSQATPTSDASKPWLPLTLALSGLIGSLAATLYVGWIAWGYRAQYRMLLERMLEPGPEPPSPPTPDNTTEPPAET